MKRGRFLALACLTLLLACSGKLCGDSYLAELEAHRGEVQRDEAQLVGSWGSVRKGDRFRVGDGLRTGRTGSAQLGLAADGVALVEANTVLRFLDRDPRGGRRLSLVDGIIRVDSGGLTLDVHTPRALAKIEKGTSIRIISADGDARFDVLVGKVAIDAEGATKQVLAGESFSTGAEPEKSASTTLEDDSSKAKTLGVDAADEPLSARGAVDLALPAVDAVTLHAPSLPVTFRLAPPPCAETIGTELDGRAVTQSDASGALVRVSQAGAHRLRVRCGKRVLRQTVLRVQRDAASLELPTSAQRVEVEADGRRYTLRYQNVMPVVNVHWTDARPADSYSLLLRRGSRNQTFRVKRPGREIASHELTEGNYEFWFTSDNGQQSKVGSLRIEFDNTARSLSLSEPVEGSSATGDTATVSGVALLRSQVSANDTPLTLDPKGRFHAQVKLGSEKTILVRASHPAAGVHYYLRRLR